MIKEKVPQDAVPAGAELAALLAGLGPGRLDERDGVKWTGADAWIHVRPSNTEPAVRIIAEASTAEAARQLIARVRTAI